MDKRIAIAGIVVSCIGVGVQGYPIFKDFLREQGVISSQPAPRAASIPQGADDPNSAYVAHIASMSTRLGAENTLNELEASERDLLAGRTHYIRPVSANGGTLWRAAFGPYPTRAEAAALCEGLQAGGRYCSVLSVPR